MIKDSVARSIGAAIKPSTQSALQADGRSPLKILGETKLQLQRDHRSYELDALVVESIDVDILAGVPFMMHNDITLRPAKHEVIFSNGHTYRYNSERIPNSGTHSIRIRRAPTHILRAPAVNTTIWPGEFLEIPLPLYISSLN